MPAPAEVQAATLDKFIAAWKAWKPDDSFPATWSADFTQQTLPSSLGMPVRSREEMAAFLPVLIGVMSNFELTVHNVVHDAPHGKAAIYIKTKADTPAGPLHNEAAVFIWFDESGEKVAKMEEMMDSAAVKEVMPKLQQYLAEFIPGLKPALDE